MKKTVLWIVIFAQLFFGVVGNAELIKISAQETDQIPQPEQTPPKDAKRPPRRSESPTPTPTPEASPTPTASPTPAPTPAGATDAELREAQRSGRENGNADGAREGEEIGREEGERRGLRDGRERGAEICRRRNQDRATALGFDAGRAAGGADGRRDGLDKGRRDGLDKGTASGAADGLAAGRQESDALRTQARAAGVARADSEGESLAAQAAAQGKTEGDKRALVRATADYYQRGRAEFYAAKLAEAPRFLDSIKQPKARLPVARPAAPKKTPAAPRKRKTALLVDAPRENDFSDDSMFSAFFVKTSFARRIFQQEDVPVPNNLDKSKPEFTYRRGARTFRTAEELAAYNRAYSRGYENSWEENYRDTFRRAFREEFPRGREAGCRTTEPNRFYQDEIQNYRGNYDYQRFVADGETSGRKAGYDEKYREHYDLTFQTAYQPAYDSAYRKERDEELAKTQLELEEIRRAAYDARVRDINRRAYDAAEQVEYDAKYQIYADRQFALGGKDETLELQQKPVRLLEAAPIAAADGTMTLSLKIRNFGKTAAPAAGLQIMLIFDAAQIEMLSPTALKPAKNLRAASQTDITDVFAFKLKNPALAGQKVKINLLSKGKLIGEREITLPANNPTP